VPKFSYVMRPSKHVERTMIVELCGRLHCIAPFKKYGYFGFGALEYVDFDLMHRALGITKMVSIECDETWPKRYEFNRPFKGIELLIGRASQHLPTLDWNGPRIVWLDYECQLTREVLRDVESVTRVAHQGSLLVVTVQAGAPFGRRRQTLVENVGEERVPLDVEEADLEGPWAFAARQREILTNAATATVAARLDGAKCIQLLNFHYADNARMQTVGWLFSSDVLDQTVQQCRFDQLDFVRNGADPMVLKVPVLTRGEIAFLNKKLPLSTRGKLKEAWIDEDAQADYARIYRYYPSFL
jgi:hypothetical protein